VIGNLAAFSGPRWRLRHHGWLVVATVLTLSALPAIIPRPGFGEAVTALQLRYRLEKTHRRYRLRIELTDFKTALIQGTEHPGVVCIYGAGGGGGELAPGWVLTQGLWGFEVPRAPPHETIQPAV
jgi:hypothetical protein